MQKLFLLSFFFLLTVVSFAQVEDSVDIYKTTKNSIENNSQKESVSLFGNYASAGFGGSFLSNINGLSGVLSYSLAYKSHLLSFTWLTNGTGEWAEYGNGFHTNSLSLLIGESYRVQNMFLSISVGAAKSKFGYQKNIDRYKADQYFYSGISMPVEVKFFFLAYNWFGFGIHLSHDLTLKNSPTSWCISIVTGKWNKWRKSKNISR